MIRGTTTLIAHLGYPTEAFKSPMIYDPYFEQAGVLGGALRRHWPAIAR